MIWQVRDVRVKSEVDNNVEPEPFRYEVLLPEYRVVENDTAVTSTIKLLGSKDDAEERSRVDKHELVLPELMSIGHILVLNEELLGKGQIPFIVVRQLPCKVTRCS